MIKYLVTIEYRYNDIPNSFNCTYRNKIDTIIVSDSLDIAIEKSNNVLIELEKNFELNEHYNIKQRLGVGYMKRSISNLGYINTPFTFFLSITELKYNCIKESLKNVTESVERYKKYKESE